MSLRQRFLGTLACLLLAGSVFADEPVIAPDKYVYCTVCHGIDMGGNHIIAAPRLAGMEDWYIAAQLQAFKQGWRGVKDEDHYGHEMRPMAAALSDDEISEVADYVAAVSAPPPAVTLNGDAVAGQELYGLCAACHGSRGEGNAGLKSPSLTGLNDWYLLTQLKNYKAGLRGFHPDDTLGLQMRGIVEALRDEQAMLDVIAYIATLDSD